MVGLGEERNKTKEPLAGDAECVCGNRCVLICVLETAGYDWQVMESRDGENEHTRRKPQIMTDAMRRDGAQLDSGQVRLNQQHQCLCHPGSAYTTRNPAPHSSQGFNMEVCALHLKPTVVVLLQAE